MVRTEKKLSLFFAKNGVMLGVLVLVFLFYSGIVPVYNRNPYISLVPKENVVRLEGYVSSNPVKISSGNFYRCSFDLTNAWGRLDFMGSKGEGFVSSEARGRVYLYIPSAFVESHYPGRLYSAANTKQRRNPVLVETGARFVFDAKYSLNDFSSSPSILPIFFATTGESKGFDRTIRGRIAFLRGLCRLELKRILFSWKEAGGLLLALLCGSGEYTDFELSSAFRYAGLAHILALSGMHLSFFSGLASFTSRCFGKRLSDFFALLVVFCFVWFAGLTPSLFRAMLCTLLSSISGLCGFRMPMLRILAFSFVIHVCIMPQDLFQLSFQLSYGSLAGILVFGRFFEPLFYRVFPSCISSGLCASGGAQIISAPISLAKFGFFAAGGIIASVVVSPLVLFFLGAGLFSVVAVLLFPESSAVLGVGLNLVYNCICMVVRFFARLPVLEI